MTARTARKIGTACGVHLLLLGLFYAATGTVGGTLVAVFAFTAGIWCLHHRNRLAGA